MPFFIKAFSLCLFDYPIINSHYDVSNPFEYINFSSHNISVAIDSPKGLVVPNIKNCENLSILQIQEELKRIMKASQEGRLGPKELFGGTVTLSNIGNFFIFFFIIFNFCKNDHFFLSFFLFFLECFFEKITNFIKIYKIFKNYYFLFLKVERFAKFMKSLIFFKIIGIF